jgi:putative tricarboxylic transport membrane protein
MGEKTKEIICSVIFAVFGGFMYLEAAKIHPLMEKDLGSGFFPKIIGLSIFVVAIIQLILTIKREAPKETKNDQEDSKGGLFTIAAIAGYTVLYDVLGFILSTMIYLFIQICILSSKKNRNYKLFALVSVITPFIIYALFVYVIDMPLPEGLLSF